MEKTTLDDKAMLNDLLITCKQLCIISACFLNILYVTHIKEMARIGYLIAVSCHAVFL